jgi:hypothetical protein
VEFDYKIEEQVISKIENLLLKKHAWYDLGVNFYNGQTCVLQSLILQPQMV